MLRSFFAFLVSGAEAAGPDWTATRAALVDLAEGSLVTALGCSYDMRVSVCGWFGGARGAALFNGGSFPTSFRLVFCSVPVLCGPHGTMWVVH